MKDHHDQMEGFVCLKRKGMSTGAMIAVSTAIIALFSPVLRRRLKSMTQMNMSSMMKGANHQHQDSSRHESAHIRNQKEQVKLAK